MDIPFPSNPWKSNFCFPIPDVLNSDRVQLTPLILTKHASIVHEQLLLYPEAFTYLPFGPFKDLDEFNATLIEGPFSKDIGIVLFVVYDKTKPAPDGANVDHPGAIAGIIALLSASAPNLSVEIGCVVIFPPFQRTHVTSNAVGLLLKYCLDVPSPQDQNKSPAQESAPNALGLRRVFWKANARNKPSVRTAERLGFRFEGILRWDKVLPASRDASIVGNGVTIREGDPKRECVGRDTALLAMCWDDWEDGGRKKVEEIMNRSG